MAVLAEIGVVVVVTMDGSTCSDRCSGGGNYGRQYLLR